MNTCSQLSQLLMVKWRIMTPNIIELHIVLLSLPFTPNLFYRFPRISKTKPIGFTFIKQGSTVSRRYCESIFPINRGLSIP